MDKINFIAEIGGNHNGDFAQALSLTRAAINSGAHIIKYQIYSASELVTANQKPLPLAKTVAKTQLERFRSLEFSEEQWICLSKVCREANVVPAASIFDAKLLQSLSPYFDILKVASGEVTNLPLLELTGSLDKPVILSTGMASRDEIGEAIAVLDCADLTLLHCVSKYPHSLIEADLAHIQRLAQMYPYQKIGYSCHCENVYAVYAAALAGAKTIEKHFTTDRNIAFGDHKHSILPVELAEFIGWNARFAGNSEPRDRTLSVEELSMRREMRRGVYANRIIEKGEIVSVDDVRFLRPETGLSISQFLSTQHIAEAHYSKGDPIGS